MSTGRSSGTSHFLIPFLPGSSRHLFWEREEYAILLHPFPTRHNDRTACVALEFEASADIVVVAAAVGPIVADIVAAVAHN